MAGAAALQWYHLRRIATDPEFLFLSRRPGGRPVTVTSGDGTVLHAEVFGDEQAPTIVLAHGWTEQLTYWAYQIHDLSRDFRVVAYDLRGHGASARPASGDYTLARFGEDVEAVLAATVPEGERAVLVGHSLGAMSIAAWAERHPVERRVRAAALLNTGLADLISEQQFLPLPYFARSLADPIGRYAILGAPAKLPDITSLAHHMVIRYLAFGPKATAGQIAHYERMFAACLPEVRAGCGLAMADMDLRHALSKLTVPTLVVAGARDKLTPVSHGARIASALPQLTDFVVIPGAGHMGPIEQGEQVSAALRELAQPTGSSGRAAAG